MLIWSGGILTLNYVSIPGIPSQKIDPTFIASVFTGVLAGFGIQTASKKGDGTYKSNGENGQVSKKDMEKMIEKAAAGAAVQTIRIEQAPLVIKAEKTVPIPAPTPANAIVDKPAPINLAACTIIYSFQN